MASTFDTSRHSECRKMIDPNTGATRLEDREPARFRESPEVIQHVVREGETYMSIAAKYYRTLPRPSALWWLIADFQPEPVIDPTIELPAGAIIYVPPANFAFER